jgi:hypothetical protein
VGNNKSVNMRGGYCFESIEKPKVIYVVIVPVGVYGSELESFEIDVFSQVEKAGS